MVTFTRVMPVVYYILLKPLSLLPMSVLYTVSELAYAIIYRFLKYRRDVVDTNIRNAFPNLSAQEQHGIGRRFYRHLCDLIAESIKAFSITGEEVQERMVSKNPEIIDHYFDQGRSVLLVGGHYSNWELYAMAIDGHIKHQTYAVYTPIKNMYLDEKMRETRGKYGMKMIPAKQVRRVLEEAQTSGQPIAMIFATDQSPSNARRAYWMDFLNQDTGVLFGTEKYAQEFDMPVIYGEMSKPKRGHYEVVYQLITDRPKALPYGEITKLHTRELEKTIRKRPDLWLWSHRRWKRSRPENVNEPS